MAPPAYDSDFVFNKSQKMKGDEVSSSSEQQLTASNELIVIYAAPASQAPNHVNSPVNNTALVDQQQQNNLNAFTNPLFNEITLNETESSSNNNTNMNNNNLENA